MVHGNSSEERLQRILSDASRTHFVFLVFSAPWCVPCKKLYKTLKKWSHKLHDVHVVIVDVSKHPGIAHTYDIAGVPTIKVVRNDHIVAEAAGEQSKGDLKNLYKQAHAAANTVACYSCG